MVKCGIWKGEIFFSIGRGLMRLFEKVFECNRDCPKCIVEHLEVPKSGGRFHERVLSVAFTLVDSDCRGG
jgi:hypothetical protein